MSNSALSHPFAPVYDEDSRILILGTFPSVKSRQNDFYYGHPQNRFWPLLSVLLQVDTPQTIAEKRELLLSHHIAIWDVAASCTIRGSADSTIDDVIPNDLAPIFEQAPIQAVFTNGKKAKALYDTYQSDAMIATALPSTSPANGQYSMTKLQEHWETILQYL